MNDDSLKNFRESYVFHCLVIKVLCLSTAHSFYHYHFRLSRTFLSFFKLFKWLFVIRRCISNSFTLSHSFLNVKYFFEVFIFSKIQNSKRRRRDLNPRAGHPTYTLSRGTSSASWVFLPTELNCISTVIIQLALTVRDLLYKKIL